MRFYTTVVHWILLFTTEGLSAAEIRFVEQDLFPKCLRVRAPPLPAHFGASAHENAFRIHESCFILSNTVCGSSYECEKTEYDKTGPQMATLAHALQRSKKIIPETSLRIVNRLEHGRA